MQNFKCSNCGHLFEPQNAISRISNLPVMHDSKTIETTILLISCPECDTVVSVLGNYHDVLSEFGLFKKL